MSSYLVFTLAICAVAVSAQGPYQYSPFNNAQVATGSIGGQYGQQTGVTENHDKKNFGLNFSSDKGESSNLKNVNAQVAGSGAYAQGLYPQYPQQYPINPYSSYPYQYQQIPQPQVPQISRPSGGWGR